LSLSKDRGEVAGRVEGRGRSSGGKRRNKFATHII